MSEKLLDLMVQRTAWMVIQGERAGHKNLTGLAPSQRARFSELTIEVCKTTPFQEVEEAFRRYLAGQNSPPDLYSVIVWLSAFTVNGQEPYRAKVFLDLVLERLGFQEDADSQTPIATSHLYWLETLVDSFLRISVQLPPAFTTRLRRLQICCERMLQSA